MIRLKNIRLNNNFVICDIYPEDSIESGYIKINMINKTVDSYLLPSGYEYCENHIEHAKNFIIKDFEEIKTIPIFEKTLIWY